MSRSSRLSGKGGILYFAPDEARVRRFRKKYKPGQQVRGRLLRMVGRRQGLIAIEDHKLLAYFKSNPPVNSHLTFKIVQLHPHIVLQEEAAPSDRFDLYI
jgi:hypothetical protein